MVKEIQSNASVNELAALLIPVGYRQLLLPNVAVAEIIPYKNPDVVEDQPDWFLGYIQWRNISVPIISFETLNEEAFESQSKSRRVIILNGLIENDQLPFCGFVAETMPRLMRVMSSEVVTEESANPGPAELSRVLVSGEQAAIPNVDFIQEELLGFIR